ncbi:MAG: DUF2281 domain-containing protein [Lachnospiraceae bacterium]|nr:DUF2281 domain-containing protein [Lachnospiraceae bacterium]
MAYDILLKEAKDLPEDMIEQAIEFIRFLKYAAMQKQAEHTGNGTATFQRSVNPLADEFVSIADDFDETPECFKEYV